MNRFDNDLLDCPASTTRSTPTTRSTRFGPRCRRRCRRRRRSRRGSSIPIPIPKINRRLQIRGWRLRQPTGSHSSKSSHSHTIPSSPDSTILTCPIVDCYPVVVVMPILPLRCYPAHAKDTKENPQAEENDHDDVVILYQAESGKSAPVAHIHTIATRAS